MFVKLGQVLSTRADLLPVGVVAELSRLQDQVAPAPPDAVRALLEVELGRPLAEVFAEFDPEPIAAASIAQAYRGRLRSGEAVVVKVQRPGIAESVDRDLLVLAELARVAEARTAWGADYQVTDLAGEFADRPREELDFRLEARNATEIAALTDNDQVCVPVVHTELSTARILVMEWLDGVSVRETLLVLADGRLGLIDFGAAGRLDPSSRRRCARCWSPSSSATPGCSGRPCLRSPACAATSTTTSWSGPLPASCPGTWPPGPPPARPCSTTCCSCSSPSGSTSHPSSPPSSAPWSPSRAPSPPCPRAIW
jgi:ubiquinone biosynthesis protein